MEVIEYSIIIPVFNAANALEKLHSSITDFFKGKNYSYEIIYVDDSSSDNSWSALKQIKQTAINTTIVRLSKNFGQHAATVCGFKYAKGNFIITMDDDLEVHPKEIQKLIEEQTKSDADLVYGIYKKKKQSLLRSIFTWVYKLLSKFDGQEKCKGSSYRLIKKELTQKLVTNHKQFLFIDELCLWYTKKLSFVNVEANPNYIFKTRYKMGGLFKMAKNIILFSSSIPLRLVTNVGFILAGTNFIIGLFFIIKKFYFKIDVEGFTSLIVSILFSTGLIILCLGILAQYMSQVIRSLNNAPPYNEDEIIC